MVVLSQGSNHLDKTKLQDEVTKYIFPKIDDKFLCLSSDELLHVLVAVEEKADGAASHDN